MSQLVISRLFKPSVCKNFLRRTNVRLLSSITIHTTGPDSEDESTVLWPSSTSAYPFLLVNHVLENPYYCIESDCSKKKQVYIRDKKVGEDVCDAMTVGFSRDGLRFRTESSGLVVHYKPSNSKLEDMTVYLPPLPADSKIESLAMSSLPKRDKDWVVGVKLSGSRLSLCRPFGSSTWIDIKKTSQSINPLSSLMFSKRDGRFYIPSHGGNYLCYPKDDVDELEFRPLRFDDLPNSVVQELEEVSSCSRADHLVESPTGKHFLVKWYSNDSMEYGKEEWSTSRLEDVTEKFMVFREDQGPRHYSKNMIYTEDIGDLCIFLGHSEAFCVPASSSPGLKPNCIYFVGRNFGVYDLTTKTCTTLCAEVEDDYDRPLRRTEFPYWPPPLPL